MSKIFFVTYEKYFYYIKFSNILLLPGNLIGRLLVIGTVSIGRGSRDGLHSIGWQRRPVSCWRKIAPRVPPRCASVIVYGGCASER